uniref:Uncharacterized protein n=1 Tax=Astyanax mexicanus TaxID=7994 RepID=A0A3B1IS98_ASTMX
MYVIFKYFYALFQIDSVQSLLQCPSILVCVGREPFHPLLLDNFRKTSDNKLPKLILKSRSSAYNEEPGCKNADFGLETKKTIIHPRSHASDKSARHTASSEKYFPNGLSSVPPIHTGPFSQKRESMMDDDIEKRVLVNKDGSLSMEMKVRFRLLNDETLHWSTEIKKSSSTLNESVSGYNDAYYLQHANSESFSEAESLPEADNTKLHQKHTGEPHCQHCCAHCQEYDIWKNPTLGEQGPVRRIISSSSSESSHKIVCKKASVDSMGTMSSEEYTEQVVSNATCIHQSVGEECDTTVKYCTISRCSNRSEVSAVSSKKAYTEEECRKTQNSRALTSNDNKPESSPTTPIKNFQADQVSVQITQVLMGEHRSVSVESNSSQVLASLKEDQDEEETGGPPSNSRVATSSPHSITSCKSPASPNQQLSPRPPSNSRVATSSPHSITSCKSPASPNQQLSPRPPSKSSGSSVKSRSRHCQYQRSKDVVVADEHEPSESSAFKTSPQPNADDLHDTNMEDVGDDTTTIQPIETNKKERSSSAMSTRSNASAKSNKSKGNVVPEEECRKTQNSRALTSNDNKPESSPTTPIKNFQADQVSVQITQVLMGEHRSVSVESNSSQVLASLKEDQDEEETGGPPSNSRVATSSPHSITSCKSPASPNQQLSPRPPSKSSGSSVKSRSRHCQYQRSKDVVVADEHEPSESSAFKTSPQPNADDLHDTNMEDVGDDTTTIQPIETNKKERTASAMSTKSNLSARSIQSDLPDVSFTEAKETESETEERVQSAMSNTSVRSRLSEVAADDFVEDQIEERVPSAMSAVSAKSRSSIISELETSELKDEDNETEERSASAMSIKSNASAQSKKSCLSDVTPAVLEEAQERVPSIMSTKSNASAASKKSNKSQGTPADTVETSGKELEERAPSAMSAKSDISARSINSNISEAVPSVTYEDSNEHHERKAGSAMSQTSGKSSTSNIIAEVDSQTNETGKEALEERAPSARSTKSKKSKISEQVEDVPEEQATERSTSALSSISNVSAKSKKSKISEQVEDVPEEQATERSTSALSSISNVSAKSKKSKISEQVEDVPEEQATERSTSALSSISNVSAKSKKSKVSEQVEGAPEKQATERSPSALSSISNVSAKSKKSKISEQVEDAPEEQATERSTSALSSISNVSAKSKKSKVSEQVEDAPEEQATERSTSALSSISNVSAKSKKSKISEQVEDVPEEQATERSTSALSSISNVSAKSRNLKFQNKLKVLPRNKLQNDLQVHFPPYLMSLQNQRNLKFQNKLKMFQR